MKRRVSALPVGFAVPADASTGTATFTCDVRVLGRGGVSATSSSPFEVV